MCAIFGAVFSKNLSDLSRIRAANLLNYIIANSRQRGEDGFGIQINRSGKVIDGYKAVGRLPDNFNYHFNADIISANGCSVIGAYRAEPTPEYIKFKTDFDQQPMGGNKWSIVHNGTIANDKAIRDCLKNVYPSTVDSSVILDLLELPNCDFHELHRLLKGSFAILAMSNEEFRQETLFYSTNYKPLWFYSNELGTFFASSESFFPNGFSPIRCEPYSSGIANSHTMEPIVIRTFKPVQGLKKVLSICSGGLDSVVATTLLVRNNEYGAVEMLHFRYGCRAESNELHAVTSVAQRLGVELHILEMPIYSRSDSPILNTDDKIAERETGAEYAHEWVPARNLVMLAMATAYAEANGFTHIALGANLEEAGAYPDNEPEFIDSFNRLLPFSVNSNVTVKVIAPLQNKMKHEIVAIGQQIHAPMDATWSCYEQGNLHCGKCGPCYMRRKAFEINNITDPIFYKEELE